jgi:hypothetical protein
VTGIVTAFGSGTCTIAASQAGNDDYAPAPVVTVDIGFDFKDRGFAFATVPALSEYDIGTITATDGAGSAVMYATSTPSVCSIDPDAGVITTLSTGDCAIVAHAGTQQIDQTIAVTAPAIPTTPGTPTAVRVTAGDSVDQVLVNVGATTSGGLPLNAFIVDSVPSGVHAVGASSPITVRCDGTCVGYAFTVTAQNELGPSDPSGPIDIVTQYHVTETFFEPDTQPNDTMFIGTFELDMTNGMVSKLQGRLSEAMTGGDAPYPYDTMTWLDLEHQLSSDTLTVGGVSGLLVTTFRLPTTNTLSNDSTLSGTNGWAPGTGMGRYYGVSGKNAGNAYAIVFVNPADPTAPLTQAQLDLLAYADCAPGGMMGATCMTGTSVAGYGTVGTMGGYPVSLAITK